MNSELNKRSREIGKKMLADVKGLKTSDDWRAYWGDRKSKFPFGFGDCWKHQFEYVVDDVAAEVGFFIEIMGLTPMAVNDDYCMFTSPNEDFHFAFRPSSDDNPATPPNAIRMEFMVDDIVRTANRFKDAGIEFEIPIRPNHIGSPLLYHGEFRTPNGIAVELWGMVSEETHSKLSSASD